MYEGSGARHRAARGHRHTDPIVDPTNVDDDGDGYAEVAGDCDDSNGAVNPGATDQTGNIVDENCDGLDGVDVDGDGHASLLSGGDDCDDAAGTTFPGAPEIWYDGQDNG